MADPVDLWGAKSPAPGIPLDLNFIALLVLAGFAMLLTGVIAYEIWHKIRRRRRRHSRDARSGDP